MIEGELKNGEPYWFTRVIDGEKDTMEIGYWKGSSIRYGTGVKFHQKYLVEMGNYSENGGFEPSEF